MTQATLDKAAEEPRTKLNTQRQDLGQIARLSMESAAEEQRIEQQHEDALKRENGDFEKKMQAARLLREEALERLAQNSQAEEEALASGYAQSRQDAESGYQGAQLQLARKRKEIESNLKKQVEQTSWQAESVLVTLQMAMDQEELKAKELLKASKAELASLSGLEEAGRRGLARYRVEAALKEPVLDEGLKGRLESERAAVLAEYRQRTMDRLRELHELSAGRVVEDIGPWFLVLLAAAIGAGVGWVTGKDPQSQMWTAVGAAGGVIVLGAILVLIMRAKKRARLKEKARGIGETLMAELSIAMEAARFDAEAAALARQRKVDEGMEMRDRAVGAVKEKARGLLIRAVEEHKAGLVEEQGNFQKQMGELERKRDEDERSLKEKTEATRRQIEEEATRTIAETERRHAATVEAIEAKYAQDTAGLEARWKQGLHAAEELMAMEGEMEPELLDWNSPAWEKWKPAKEFSGLLRFGELEINLARLSEAQPKRLCLPGTFNIPAMLEMPAHGSLYIEADHTGRDAAMDAGRMVMARLLTRMPPGRVKFTIFDPVGLGQSFAGFMHLADHDESLVGSRIWTEKEHMTRRLADLTEHMETVIQKYLRNEYASIDQYNAQAGELAEPIRYLVLADFPTGFDQEMLRRLAGIAMSGPRCGVYTIILRDVRQQLPAGSRIEEIVAKSVRLRFKNGAFEWDDAVFKQFPLRVDAGPEEKTLTRLMEQVGKAALDAKRVEVSFASIAPKDGQFWSMSSKNELRVPIGKSGATRLQSLRLGVGVAQHTLVAGKTGSGKSNLMHTIVTNLAMWYGPDEVEFYLVDFKKGVEFKAYVNSELPHARAIAVESDREFGLSVLQRVDAELTRRGTMFRDAGVQEISSYRDKMQTNLPRCILLIDEFQEFFSEEDKVSQEAAGLMDRLVRQGRAFGVHLILGSQTIGGTSGLGRSTLGQIAVRVALQCTEADSQMILGDNNSAARLLTRPGEAIYNDAGGLVEANSPFQIAYLPDETRERYLEHVREVSQEKQTHVPTPIVFEGNTAAGIRKNAKLMELLERPTYGPVGSIVPAYIGEPVAIKEPTAIPFRRQSGVNVLMVGQQEESAVAIVSSMVASLAAQHPVGEAMFYLMDGSPADSRYFRVLERVLKTVPHAAKVVEWREVPQAIDEIAKMLGQRQGGDAQAGPAVYLMIFGLQRYRLLRKQEEDFSFRRGEEAAAPKPDKQFAELLSEGPAHGIHVICWADTPITVERTLERSAMRQFDNRVLFQMSASDSSNLIDSPAANRLGEHRALLYSEEKGTIEKFRPYDVPEEAWLAYLSERLKKQ